MLRVMTALGMKSICMYIPTLHEGKKENGISHTPMIATLETGLDVCPRLAHAPKR
jgi:hypothetical protein